MICLARMTAFAVGCGAGAAKAARPSGSTTSASAMARAVPAIQLAIMAHSSADESATLDDAYALATRENGRLCKPNEQAMLDHAGDGRKPLRQRSRIGNSLKCGIKNPVPAIRDESVAVLVTTQQRRPGRAHGRARSFDRPAGGGQSERHHLDRQRE